jgi:hypothetical protein
MRHALHCEPMADQFLNIQAIDGAVNCVYDVFAAAPEEFSLIFPPGTDIAFIDEVCERHDTAKLSAIFSRIWQRRVRKRDAVFTAPCSTNSL